MKNTRSRRVLIIYHSSSRVCGIGTWVEALYRELEKRGWDVTVGLAWGRRFHNPEVIERFRPGLKTLWMDGRTGTEEGRIQALERAVERSGADVVIHSCLDAGFEAARRLRYRGRNFRFVVVNHGNIPGQAACIMGHRDIVDLAVCVSRNSYEAMSLGETGFAGGRIAHLPNGVAMPLADVRRDEETRNIRVGFAGRLSDEAIKKVSDLRPFTIELLESNSSAEIWIAGEGALEPVMHELTRLYPSRVKYMGALTREELYQNFYPAIDVLVHFSVSEAFGLTIAEAMAHGVVPVSSAFRGLAESRLIQDGINGFLFPVGDVGQAVALTSLLLKDPARTREMGERAAKHIRDHFSLDRFGKAWSDALNAVLQLPALPVPPRPASLDKKGRFGVREVYLEYARRLLRRRVPHASAGEEWPHFVCSDTSLELKVADRMRPKG